MEFEKLKKIISDRPTHTRETGSGKGKQKYFKVGLIVFNKLKNNSHSLFFINLESEKKIFTLNSV